MSKAFEKINALMDKRQSNLTAEDVKDIEFWSGGIDVDELDAMRDINEAIWELSADLTNKRFHPENS